MITRRTFILTGVGGALLLASGAWWRSHDPTKRSPTAEDPPTRLLGYLAPAMLDGAVPAEPRARASALAAGHERTLRAVAQLPPAAQGELHELLAMLDTTAGRVLFAGLLTPWSAASRDDIVGVLERWRTSRIHLRRSAYDALHQLVLGSWYAGPDTWPAIGYPGPPAL